MYIYIKKGSKMTALRYLRYVESESFFLPNSYVDIFQIISFQIPNFKCKAKLANESFLLPLPPLCLSPSVFSSLSLSCSCCHGDMTRKQRRSDEMEWRGLVGAVIEGGLPNKPELFYSGIILNFVTIGHQR